MPTVRFPAAMKYYTDNQSEISVSGSTVTEAVNSVVAQYPQLKVHVFDAEGKLRRHFNVFVNGEHIRELDGMQTVLGEQDKIILMASSAGG
jgi:adenylyltransferase/sulfurtransferase